MKRNNIVVLLSVALAVLISGCTGFSDSYAVTFTPGKVVESNSSPECIGALDISSLTFNNQTISVKIRNVAEIINLTDIRASIEYSDAANNKEISINDYGGTDPLSVGSTTLVIYDTGSAIKPYKIEVLAYNCMKYPATLFFR